MHHVSTYLSAAFADTTWMTAAARRCLEGVDYDTMIGTGLSGALVVPTLARALHKQWAIVRKPGDGSHAHGATYEGRIGKRWIFVDDFIVTGDTFKRVLGTVSSEVREWDAAHDHVEDVQCVGAYLYQFSEGFVHASSLAASWGPSDQLAVELNLTCTRNALRVTVGG